MPNFFEQNDTKTALEAQYAAQKIAFAPIIFQVAKTMRDIGILELLYQNDKVGLSLEQITQKIDLTSYGIKTLLESSLSADIVKSSQGKYHITKTGYFLLKDEMTKINSMQKIYPSQQLGSNLWPSSLSKGSITTELIILLEGICRSF